MATYNVSLSVAEDMALSHVAVSQQDWIENAVKERCRIAVDKIVQIAVQRCLSDGVPVPGSQDEIVALAFSQGWVKTAAERNAEAAQQLP